MKFNKLFISLACIATMSFVACEDYEDDYMAGELSEGIGLAFDAQTKSVKLLPSDTKFNVPLHRVNASSAASYNVKIVKVDSISAVDPFCIVPSTVSFAAGESTKNLTVDLAEGCSLQTTYNLVLALEGEVDNPYTSGSIESSVSVVIDYTWVSAGSVMMTSGWAGTSARINLQKAKENPNLYRLVSPFYVLEKDYCDLGEGYHIQFYLDDDYNAVSLPLAQNIGESSSKGGVWNLYYTTEGSFASYCSFTNANNVYTISGIWAYGDESLGYSPYNTASESFVWDVNYPLELPAEIDYTIVGGLPTIDDYVGDYSISYKAGGLPVDDQVSIEKISDNVVSINTIYGFEVKAEFFAGLLYISGQTLGEDYITASLVKDITAYPYDTTTGEPNDSTNVYLVGGFNENGQLVFTSAVGNVSNADGLWLSFELSEGDIEDVPEGVYEYDVVTDIYMTPVVEEEEEEANKSFVVTSDFSSLKGFEYKPLNGKFSTKRISTRFKGARF